MSIVPRRRRTREPRYCRQALGSSFEVTGISRHPELQKTKTLRNSKVYMGDKDRMPFQFVVLRFQLNIRLSI